MDINTPDLNALWIKLSEIFESILNVEPISQAKFNEIHNAVYRYFNGREYESLVFAQCKIQNVSKGSENQKTDRMTRENVDDNIIKKLPAGILYCNIKMLLKNHLKAISKEMVNREGEDYLRFYANAWTDYEFASRVISNIMEHMNKSWIPRQHQHGCKIVKHFYTLAMNLWTDACFRNRNLGLTETCLKLIKDSREGKLADQTLVKKALQTFVNAHYSDAGNGNKRNATFNETLTIYISYFEKQFLEETENFYQIESYNDLEMSPSDYIKKIHSRLVEEENRVEQYLHIRTLEPLQEKLYDILIQKNINLIYKQSKEAIKKENINELRIIYQLVERINATDKLIEDYFSEHWETCFTDKIRSEETKTNPKAYIDVLIEICSKSTNMVAIAFCSNPKYQVKLQQTLNKLFNKNAVTEAANSSKKTAEFLARYCDMFLRRGSKVDDSNIEEAIDQVMSVFNYIDDKDAFQKFYGKMLAKRLMHELSVSDDYEVWMITRLKEMCGFEYVSKYNRMYQDISISKKLNDEYSEVNRNSQSRCIIDFSVTVLTSNAWPFTMAPVFNFPEEISAATDNFTSFYLKKYHGRKLTWLHQHSKGEMRAHFNKATYFLSVTTYQITILILFNSADSFTVQQILDITGIEGTLLTQNLFNLLKCGLLICLERDVNQPNLEKRITITTESVISTSHIIKINDGFKNKNIKINLTQPTKTAEQKEIEAISKTIDDDRSMVIQAAIVRIMKAHQTLSHTNLVTKVLEQLMSRFKPSVHAIKRSIDLLIEKEYLKRDSKEKSTYTYT